MNIKTFVCNPIEENTIVLYDDSGEAVVIDCGCLSRDEKQALQHFLEENNLTPVALLNTHLHIDHILGNAFMLERYALSAKAHRADESWLTDALAHAAHLGIRGAEAPPPLGGYLDEGDTIHFGHSELRPIHVPGHSAGSLCYYCEEEGVLVSGDVLFEGCIGRSDLPGGDPHLLVTGIREKLFALPGDTRVLPGHGNPTTILRERRFNPYVTA
ncbi:MAG: MBL fold metallo-hydrolase [Odoribacteraceae bacterium]|jgi:glyoxylase-like metal-dependent hydrolase (beta-lactamase superfamily II)|nr:MBL fold metallo-hydrolase [Odoribacteraceae bacterium]